MNFGSSVVTEGIIETWKIIFFLINIFSKSWIWSWKCPSISEVALHGALASGPQESVAIGIALIYTFHTVSSLCS